MERLKEILVTIQGWYEGKAGVAGIDASILDCATRIYISENIARERNGGFKPKQETKIEGDWASIKQRNFMSKLGIAWKNDMTKDQARIAIDEILNK